VPNLEGDVAATRDFRGAAVASAMGRLPWPFAAHTRARGAASPILGHRAAGRLVGVMRARAREVPGPTRGQYLLTGVRISVR
jgi:hypothetical protein